MKHDCTPIHGAEVSLPAGNNFRQSVGTGTQHTVTFSVTEDTDTQTLYLPAVNVGIPVLTLLILVDTWAN